MGTDSKAQEGQLPSREELDMPRPKSLLEMREEVHTWAIGKGWWDKPRSLGDLIALMHSELSEALEAYREHGLDDFTEINGDGPAKPEGVASELADLFIRLLDTCGFYQFDLEAEYERKMRFNATRPHRHGGKLV